WERRPPVLGGGNYRIKQAVSPPSHHGARATGRKVPGRRRAARREGAVFRAARPRAAGFAAHTCAGARGRAPPCAADRGRTTITLIATRASTEHMATLVEFLSIRSWQPDCSVEEQLRALDAIENGNVVYLPKLAFDLLPGEQRFLDPAISDGRAKNISYDPASGSVAGTSLRGRDRLYLSEFVGRFSCSARALVERMLPDYTPHLRTARTSFRPVEVCGRKASSKKDDTRLHVDAFASSPNQGRRLLRVFCNVNPEGRPREWLIGGRFEP